MDYCKLEDLKASLSLSGETFVDPDLQRAITAASRGIDNACGRGRRFYPDDDATTERLYSPEDPCELDVDDLIELTSVATDPAGDGTFPDTWTLGSDFVLEPANADQDAEPWTRLQMHPNGRFRFPCLYPQSVRVTGKFGWAEPPVGVQEATAILAVKLMRRKREAPFGIVAVGLESGAVMRLARTDPDVMFLIGDYIRHRIAAA